MFQKQKNSILSRLKMLMKKCILRLLKVVIEGNTEGNIIYPLTPCFLPLQIAQANVWHCVNTLYKRNGSVMSC